MRLAEEKNFENRIKAFLTECGCWHVKYFANRNTRSGVPDILSCCGGTFLAIEVKASHGKPSELQLYNCRKIDQAGGIGLVVWPQDFAALKELITILSKGGSKKDVTCIIFANYYLHQMPVSI